MNIREAVQTMRDAFTDADASCVNVDNYTDSKVSTVELFHKLGNVQSLADVQRWLTEADVLGLWSSEPKFERAYCSLVDVAESDGVYVRPDVGI